MGISVGVMQFPGQLPTFLRILTQDDLEEYFMIFMLRWSCTMAHHESADSAPVALATASLGLFALYQRTQSKIQCSDRQSLLDKTEALGFYHRT